MTTQINIVNIVFMRHARSLGDDALIHEGRYDALLTEVGRAQAMAAF